MIHNIFSIQYNLLAKYIYIHIYVWASIIGFGIGNETFGRETKGLAYIQSF